MKLFNHKNIRAKHWLAASLCLVGLVSLTSVVSARQGSQFALLGIKLPDPGGVLRGVGILVGLDKLAQKIDKNNKPCIQYTCNLTNGCFAYGDKNGAKLANKGQVFSFISHRAESINKGEKITPPEVMPPADLQRYLSDFGNADGKEITTCKTTCNVSKKGVTDNYNTGYEPFDKAVDKSGGIFCAKSKDPVKQVNPIGKTGPGSKPGQPIDDPITGPIRYRGDIDRNLEPDTSVQSCADLGDGIQQCTIERSGSGGGPGSKWICTINMNTGAHKCSHAYVN